MARQVVNLFFQGIPANHPPAVWIRQVDHALLAGLATFLAVALALGWVTWRPLFGSPVPDGGLISQLFGYPCLVLSEITRGHLFRHAVVDNPAALSLVALHVRFLPVWLLSLAAGTAVFVSGLTPWRRMQWVSGPRLLEGKEAEAAGLRITGQELDGEEPFVWLHDALPIAKKRLTRGILMVGSPGGGKTVALLKLVRAMIDGAHGGHRALIYDAKRDMTSYFLGGSVGLMSPWDSRSLVWDIGRDCRTPQDADGLAASFIPSNDKDPYWSNSARMLFAGSVRSLQDQYATNWGWDILSERLNDDMETFAERMSVHYAKAEALVAEGSQTANSVLSTLAANTKIVDDLARAWGNGFDDAGNMRPSISFKAWAADGWPGKIRQIILQAGPDKHATAAFSSAIVNLVTPTLLSLPDDEKNRTIGIFLDELPSIGKIDFPALVERGRSAGIHVCCTCQDFSQIEAVWGPHVRKALTSMFGTQIVFRMSASGSRDELSETFGKAKWSITAVNSAGDGNASTSVHEENQAVVPSHAIGDLGLIKNEKLPEGWGIRAMVALSASGGDVLLLDFPGVSMPKRRTPLRNARWTRGPALPGVAPEPSAAARRRMQAQHQKAVEQAEQAEAARREETNREAAKKKEERRKAAMQRHLKNPMDIGDGPDFTYEPEERDHAAWAAARTEPAPPADPDSTALQRIRTGAKRVPARTS